jgi:outer membrane protein assembly factor BamE (lipoprotein component of BamABCDE complex)
MQGGIKGAVLGSVLALAGCSTTTNVGRAVDTSAVAQLRDGETTIARHRPCSGRHSRR